MNAEDLFEDDQSSGLPEIKRARDFVEFLRQVGHPFTRLIKWTGQPAAMALPGKHEFVLIEVRPEIPQHRLADIRTVERFAIGFSEKDDRPWVFSLRDDFPRLLHTNSWAGLPLSLCLTDEPWQESRLHWTPFILVEDIRAWLRRAATDENHAVDQPLELAFLEWNGDLIMPADYIERLNQGAPFVKVRSIHQGSYPTYGAEFADTSFGAEAVCLTFVAKPHVHQPVGIRPSTIKDLASLLSAYEFDILAELRPKLREIPIEHRSKPLVLLVLLPLSRVSGGEVELHQLIPALTIGPIKSVGQAVGAWILTPDGSGYGMPIGSMPLGDQPDMRVLVLHPHTKVDQRVAASMSKREQRSLRVCAVGAGALGSQVALLLARSGWSNWCLIDHDKLLPHNIVRHALGDSAIGQTKVIPLKALLEEVHGTSAQAISAGVGLPGTDSESVSQELSRAELILDFSASIATARNLAIDQPSGARRASFFLTPDGRSSVLLAEDSMREFPLDVLEMQYYRSAATNPLLSDHLASPGDRLNISRTCRDTTFQIPNELVALHASVGSGAIHRMIAHDGPDVRIWRMDPDTGAVSTHIVQPTAVHSKQVNGWWLIVDQHVINRMTELRGPKLPRETGGVLIGSIDMHRKRIYVVDLIPSPADSLEEHNCYERGVSGLTEAVEAYRVRSGQNLNYIGEWHSHPKGYAVSASKLDRELLSNLTDTRSRDACPSLMAIVGDGPTTTWYVNDADTPFVIEQHPAGATAAI